MDYKIHNIKASVWLVSSPDRHTVHKTMRAPRCRRGRAPDRVYKPPPDKRCALCGLLNVNLMAVDFTNYRETGRLFVSTSRCRFSTVPSGSLLSEWHCFIARYP